MDGGGREGGSNPQTAKFHSREKSRGKNITFKTHFRGLNCHDVAHAERIHIIFVAACIVSIFVPLLRSKDEPKAGGKQVNNLCFDAFCGL